MANRFDVYDQSLVIDGFYNGIADSPYDGIVDMRNVNIASVPGEVSVGFSTSQISPPSITAVVTGLNSNTLTFTGGLLLESRMAVQFTSVGDLTGVSIGTVYYISNLSIGYPYNISGKLYSDPQLTSVVSIGGTATSTPTFTTYVVSQVKQFVYDSINLNYWMVDSAGLVWTNAYTTGSNNYWVYTGNKPNNNSHGNGLAFYAASDGAGTLTGYIFVFSNSSIDVTKSANSFISWNYQWNLSAGGYGTYNASPTAVLKTPAGGGNSNTHRTFYSKDNTLYFCDSSWINSFYQTNPSVAFDPLTKATYTVAAYGLLPANDYTQSITQLGTKILVGGLQNVVYPWDGFSPLPSGYLFCPEYNIAEMVTVNTTTYIFAGNRGRIYQTNGTSVDLYKKIPDHISGTVEPYFTWGGVAAIKNNLYFSCTATTNAGTAINQYGGIWAINLDNTALRLTNKLSYATYAGYATAIIPNFTSSPAGAGLVIGWLDGTGNYGIDITSSTPYTGGQTTIDSDLVPIGTYEKPRNLTRIEYKLSRPLVSGEEIKLYTRLIFNTTDTGYSATPVLDDATVGNFSNTAPVDFSNAQWLQVKAVLTSTATNPSYVRLTQIRILGLVGPTLSNSPVLSV
jgi:hypothetical protein